MQLFSKQNPSRQEVTKLQQQVKTNGAGVTVLRREISELRTKVQEQQKQLQDQDQKLLEQTQIIGEQNARLAELERKLREVMESAVGNSSGSGQNEESPRKRKKAAEAIDSLRKSKRLRDRKWEFDTYMKSKVLGSWEPRPHGTQEHSIRPLEAASAKITHIKRETEIKITKRLLNHQEAKMSGFLQQKQVIAHQSGSKVVPGALLIDCLLLHRFCFEQTLQ
ncbi:hypothetical protein MC885_016081, partial [Smutsia gigantea]